MNSKRRLKRNKNCKQYQVREEIKEKEVMAEIAASHEKLEDLRKRADLAKEDHFIGVDLSSEKDRSVTSVIKC